MYVEITTDHCHHSFLFSSWLVTRSEMWRQNSPAILDEPAETTGYQHK